MKTKASGYPDWVRTPEDEDRYLDNLFAIKVIRLDKDAIRPNAAKRGLAKLWLNSMWDKLTERNNRTKSKMISNLYELHRFLSTPGIEVANLVFASDNVVWASWSFVAEEEIPSLHHTNNVIGAYVTAGARLHLYSYLDRLQERAIYCDTDSVVYVQTRDETALLEVGDNLGAMASVLRPSEFIEEFVSGGHKIYAYKTVHTPTGERKAVCKIRGITLKYSTSQLVNFEVIKDMVLEKTETRHVILHTERKIKRKRKPGEGIVSIITELEDKLCSISFFKRRGLADNTSVPFGYK